MAKVVSVLHRKMVGEGAVGTVNLYRLYGGSLVCGSEDTGFRVCDYVLVSSMAILGSSTRDRTPFRTLAYGADSKGNTVSVFPLASILGPKVPDRVLLEILDVPPGETPGGLLGPGVPWVRALSPRRRQHAARQ